MLIPTEAIVTAPAISSTPAISSAPASSSSPASSSTPAGPSAQKPPDRSPPPPRNPPSTVPTDPTGLPWAIPEWMTTCLHRKGGYPRTIEGLSLLPRIFWRHQLASPTRGVSRNHWNVPHASDNHYATTPDSSGLRRPPNQTPLCLNGSFPPRPTSHFDTGMLNCAAPAHSRTILLHSRTMYTPT